MRVTGAVGNVLLCAGVTVACGRSFAQSAEVAPEREHPFPAHVEQRVEPDRMLAAGLSVGGRIEVEVSAGRDRGEDGSDIALATLELGAEAELREWLQASATLLWEEDETEPVDLDTAMFTLGPLPDLPLFVQAGKLYLPFGVFNSHFVSDPLVLELGETRETALVLGYGGGLVDLRAGAFNGDLDEDGEDNEVETLFAALGLVPADWLSCGAYWISDIGEADGLQEALQEALDAGAAYGESGGAGAYLTLQVSSLTLEAELIAALDEFEAGLLADDAVTPMAWNLELAWAAAEAWELALRYEGSDEFPDMPESQYGVAITYALTESAALACEYLHGEYEGGEERDVVTAQAAIDF